MYSRKIRSEANMKPLPFYLSFTSIILFCSAVSRLANAQASEKKIQPLVMTLDQAISIALEQNRDVLIADQDRYKADAQISEARSGAFPQINLSGQYARNIQKPVLFLPPDN